MRLGKLEASSKPKKGVFSSCPLSREPGVGLQPGSRPSAHPLLFFLHGSQASTLLLALACTS